jgi:uncharacterized protein YjcR
MAAVTLQLLNSVSDTRGNRYTDAEHEAAYHCWSTVGRRSFAATGDKTGIAENTLRQWAKAGNWPGRVKIQDAEAAELAKVAVLTSVTAELDRSIAKLVDLRDGAKNEKVQLEAAHALLNIGGLSTKQTTATVTKGPAPTPQAPRPRLTDEERERLSAKLARLGGFADASA